jgi:hypothetical protein
MVVSTRKGDERMAHKEMAKQITGFFKTTYDSSFNTITLLREYTENTINISLQSSWFTEEGRKLVSEWLKTYKKGYDDFKIAADEQYRKLEVLFHQHNGAGAVETIKKVDKDQGTQKTKKAK